MVFKVNQLEILLRTACLILNNDYIFGVDFIWRQLC